MGRVNRLRTHGCFLLKLAIVTGFTTFYVECESLARRGSEWDGGRRGRARDVARCPSRVHSVSHVGEARPGDASTATTVNEALLCTYSSPSGILSPKQHTAETVPHCPAQEWHLLVLSCPEQAVCDSQ